MQTVLTKLLNTLKENLAYCPDTGIFTWLKSRSGAKKGAKAGAKKGAGYKYIMFCGVGYYSHRLAWFYMTGEFPKDQLDHINHIKDDNRFCNLRECNVSQNGANSLIQKNNTSGFKGVSWYKKNKKYGARIKKNGRLHHLGMFVNKIDAAKAYNKKAVEFFGEFAFQNKIEV